MLKITRSQAKANARRIWRKQIDPNTHKKLNFYCKYCETEYIKHHEKYKILGEYDVMCYTCYATETQRSMFRRLYEKINDIYTREGRDTNHESIIEAMKRADWFGEDFYERYFL